MLQRERLTVAAVLLQHSMCQGGWQAWYRHARDNQCALEDSSYQLYHKLALFSHDYQAGWVDRGGELVISGGPRSSQAGVAKYVKSRQTAVKWMVASAQHIGPSSMQGMAPLAARAAGKAVWLP